MRSRAARVSIAAAVFLGLALLRTHGISENFHMLGDQIRDWTIALRGWRDLPLSGTPTWAGGRTWGPSFYWLLWCIRHAVGPWVHNLPHAGGIGISLLQSAADAVLLVVIWRRVDSVLAALAAVLLIATNPVDLALSATIWNPPVSVVFVKFAIAIALSAGSSIWWAAAATGVAWLGVQAHLFAILTAGPIAAAFVARELLARRWRRAAETARAIVETIVVLEIPYFVDQLRHPAEQLRPVALQHHLGSLHLATGTATLIGLLRGYTTWPLGPVLFVICVVVVAAGAIVTIRRDVMLASVSVLPLAAGIVALGIWQDAIDSYWFLTLTTPFVLTVVLALRVLPMQAYRVASVAFLIIVAAAVPARVREARTIIRMPQYGALARGSLALRRRADEVSRLDLTFNLPWTCRGDFIYTTVLGGRIVPTARFAATIDRDGTVTFRDTGR